KRKLDWSCGSAPCALDLTADKTCRGGTICAGTAVAQAIQIRGVVSCENPVGSVLCVFRTNVSQCCGEGGLHGSENSRREGGLVSLVQVGLVVVHDGGRNFISAGCGQNAGVDLERTARFGEETSIAYDRVHTQISPNR